MQNAQEVINKLVPIYEEIITLSEDSKEILKDAKDAGLDSALINKVAKAKAADKLGQVQEAAEELVALIKQLH